jgi:hypothetical protein
VTQQAVTVLVSEHLAPASEKPAESGAGRMRRCSPATCWWKRSRLPGFDLDRPWRLDDRVEVRPESFGALPAYQRALGTLARSQMIARRAAP